MRDVFRVDWPQFLKPVIQQVANKNFFTGVPVVPASEVDREPKTQYGERTSKIARLIGDVFNLSPRRLDQLAQDLFSWNAMSASWLTDVALDWANIYPEDPVTRAGEGYNYVFGWGRFARGNEEPRYTKHTQKFYELMIEVDRAHATYSFYRKMRNKVAQREYKEKHKREIILFKAFRRYRNRFAKLKTRENLILADVKKSPEQKRIELEKLLARRNELVKEAVKRMEKKLDQGASK